jgi:hypothetical protein
MTDPALVEDEVIMHHTGVMGGDDLVPAVHGWDVEAPVAKVTITVVADDAHNFLARLSGAAEVPSVHTDASGRARFWLNYEKTELHYHLRVKNIDNVVAAHIHSGSASENGPVAASLFAGGPTGETKRRLARGILKPEDLVGVYSGDWDGFVYALENGGLYVNVHTTDVPSGEIRGQIGVIK